MDRNSYTEIGYEEGVSPPKRDWVALLKHSWASIALIVLVIFAGLVLLFVGKGEDCPRNNLIGGVFCSHYTSRLLGPVPGLDSFYGGMTFLPSDPNILLVAGHADTPEGAIYTVKVNRDKAGKINGFQTAQEFVKAPGIDSSIVFDPYNRGVLFASVYYEHALLQFRPGSLTPDRINHLDEEAPDMEPNIGAFAFVPSGYEGAGRVWMASYDKNTLTTAHVIWDIDTESYNLTDIINHGDILPPGVEGFFFPPLGSPNFQNRVIVTSYDDGSLYAMELDHQGIPRPNSWGQTLHFLTGLYGIEGAAMDPLTGDMLFSHQNGSIIVRVEGFASPIATSAANTGLSPSVIFAIYRYCLWYVDYFVLSSSFVWGW